MSNTPKRPRDPNQLAKLIVDIASGDQTDTLPPPKDEAAAAMGKRGGKARAASMSPQPRAEIARRAAEKRWSKPQE